MVVLCLVWADMVKWKEKSNSISLKYKFSGCLKMWNHNRSLKICQGIFELHKTVLAGCWDNWLPETPRIARWNEMVPCILVLLGRRHQIETKMKMRISVHSCSENFEIVLRSSKWFWGVQNGFDKRWMADHTLILPPQSCTLWPAVICFLFTWQPVTPLVVASFVQASFWTIDQPTNTFQHLWCL